MSSPGSDCEENPEARKRQKLVEELQTKIASSIGQSSSSYAQKSKVNVRMQGNKLATKQYRTIELGWVHQTVQVRKKTGGGTRKIVIPKDSDASIIIKEAVKLFFPDGVSKKGIRAEDLDFKICDFSNSELPAQQTVGQTYETVKPSGILRWYLNSSYKAGVQPNENSTGEQPNENPAGEQPNENPPVVQPNERPPDVQPNERPLDVQPNERPSDVQPNERPSDVQPNENPLHGVQPNEKHPGVQPNERPPDVQPNEKPPGVQPNEKPPGVASKSLELLASIDGLYPVLGGEIRVPIDQLNVFYFKDIQSVYSNKTSRISCFRSQCIYENIDDEGNLQDPNETHEPLLNGYCISEISKGERVFIQIVSDSQGEDLQADNHKYEFPCMPTAENSDFELILHHPTEVHGMENGKLVAAVISQLPNDVSYEWFCDSQPICSGKCLIQIDKPGQYMCVVKAAVQSEGGAVQQLTRVSHPLQVVHVNHNAKQELPHIASPTTDTQRTDNEDESLERDIVCNFNKCINHGSFGEVFYGTYKNACVAVKRIKMLKGKRPERLIFNEAKVHQQVQHKNIVQYIGAYMDLRFLYIVTEYIAGSNMEDTIYGLDNIDMPQKKIEVAIGVTEWVVYLHKHTPQIIHEDLKPANILLDENMCPKLCDLGLAKARSFDVASSTIGIFVSGTPAYMAPEKLTKNKKGTPTSDMWSLGMTLLEWFSGGDPWDLANQDEDPVTYIRECMVKNELPPVSSKFSLLLPALQYNPDNRPTARHLLCQL